MGSNRPPRKILMTADASGGVWTYSLELARALAPHGIEISLAIMGTRPSPEQRADAAALENVTVQEGAYRLEWQDNPWEDIDRAGRWLLDLRAEADPDLIQLNGYAHAALDWQAPCVVFAHSCLLSWWQAVHGEPPPVTFDRYRRAVAEGLERADAVVAPTRSMLDAVRQNSGVEIHGKVIPIARDPRPFHPERKQPYIFTTGQLWDEARNLETLERAARNLPWPVVAAGNTGETITPGVIRFLGHLTSTALTRHFSTACIFALPARYAPFAFSILEAALSGCALVLGDIPSLRELWEGAAVFVNPDDSGALAGALRELIANPSKRRHLAQRAQERAQTSFLPERMASDYLELYQKLISHVALSQ